MHEDVSSHTNMAPFHSHRLFSPIHQYQINSQFAVYWTIDFSFLSLCLQGRSVYVTLEHRIYKVRSLSFASLHQFNTEVFNM